MRALASSLYTNKGYNPTRYPAISAQKNPTLPYRSSILIKTGSGDISTGELYAYMQTIMKLALQLLFECIKACSRVKFMD